MTTDSFDDEEENMADVALGGNTMVEIKISQSFPEDEEMALPETSTGTDGAATATGTIDPPAHSSTSTANVEKGVSFIAANLSEVEEETVMAIVQTEDEAAVEVKEESAAVVQEQEDEKKESDAVVQKEEKDFVEDTFSKNGSDQSTRGDAATSISSIGSVSARQSFMRQQHEIYMLSSKTRGKKKKSKKNLGTGSGKAAAKNKAGDKVIEEESETTELDDEAQREQEEMEASAFRGSSCSHPCGKYEVAAVLLAFLAFLLCGVSTDRCDLIILTNDEEELQSFWDLPERDVGLIQFESVSQETFTTKCVYWFDDPFTAEFLYDDVWHAARVMSVTATFLGLFLVGFISTISCVAYQAIVFQRLAVMSLIIPLLYGLSFIILGSDVCLEGSCQLGIGGLVLILGIIVWMMLAATLFLIPSGKMIRGGASAKTQSAQASAARYGGYLGLSILLSILIILVVDFSVIFLRSPTESNVQDNPSAPTTAPVIGEVMDWRQEGESAMGPFPDSHDYVSLAGSAKIMALIGKESVLVMEYDVKRKLWYPFGNMIPANLDLSGWDPDDRVTKVKATSASLSDNGFTVAVASLNYVNGSGKGGKYEFGMVQIWEYIVGTKRWIPKGQPITGNSKDDGFAAHVEVSGDGRRVAVVASGQFGRSEPYVRVYQYDDINENKGSWVHIGQDIRLDSFWSLSGFDFSGDGSTFALGSTRIGTLGLVTIYGYDKDTKTWKRRGSPITSGSSKREDQFGESVAFNFDGTALIIGDPGGAPSFARSFWFNGDEWEQLGQDLECNQDGRCAHDVAMSYFGSMVAVTGYHASLQVTKVYSLDGPQEKWVAVGGDIGGPKTEERVESTAIDLSNDGQTVVVGTTFQDTQTQVWQYTGGRFIDVPLENNSENEGPTQPPPQNSSASLIETENMTEAALSALQIQTMENMSIPSLDINETMTNSSGSELANLTSLVSVAPYNEKETSAPSGPPKPYIRAIVGEEFAFFLFDSIPPRVERYDLSSREFLSPIMLPVSHGAPTAIGIDDDMQQVYIGFGTEIYRFTFAGQNETQISAEVADESIVNDFLFYGDIVFINAGQQLISVDRRTNANIETAFSYNELVFGTSISPRHKRIFGRTPVEIAPASGNVIRQSDLWFKDFDLQGHLVSEKLSPIGSKIDVGTAFKTWMFPDQTRVIDDQGYVFSVTNNAEHVYTVETPGIVDLAWIGGEVMVTLHVDGSLSSISQELVSTGSLQLNFTPANIAINNGQVLTFTHDLTVSSGIQVDSHYLGVLNPSLPGRPINPTGISFSPEFTFVDNDGLVYMLSKGHASIFAMDPGDNKYIEPIKLDEIPAFVAYSGDNHEIYTLREDGVLSRIVLAGQNRTEVQIATLPDTPLGLSTAGEFIFVCDDAGSFATHYTFFKNGTLVSAVDWNHVDSEYVWSEVNRKMYFFRQADPTDLMTEHIFSNGTIGVRVDSYLNNNSGFEHPIRVDPAGHRAVLGSGIIHNARTLKRLDVSLSNKVLDVAFNKGVARTMRNVGEMSVELQQWDGRTFELLNAIEVGGRGHRLFSLDENRTVALVSNGTGVPKAYVLDEHFDFVM